MDLSEQPLVIDGEGAEMGEVAIGVVGEIRNQDQQNSCDQCRKGRPSAGDSAETFPVKLATPSQALSVDSAPVLSAAHPGQLQRAAR